MSSVMNLMEIKLYGNIIESHATHAISTNSESNEKIITELVSVRLILCVEQVIYKPLKVRAPQTHKRFSLEREKISPRLLVYVI